METIDLSHNKIEEIDVDTFVKNVNLKELILSDNTDLTLSEVNFIKSDTIEKLSLANCNINEIPEGSFQNLTKLKELDLTGNPIDVSISSVNINKIIHIFYVLYSGLTINS